MKKLVNASGKDPAHAEIQGVLEAYETALNTSNIDAVLTIFTPDAVFMAPNNPSSIGTDALRAAYMGIFEAISFDTQLQVEEVVQVAPDWAFVRTRSAGFVNLRAKGQRVPDANHELFVLHKNDVNRWKIARYSFSTTNPLRN